VAIDLMTREGVAAGSTRAIATELGAAQATVHYTFGTKAELSEITCLQALISAVVALAGGRPDLVAVAAD
jgi:AcrR family transcriptional regulator